MMRALTITAALALSLVSGAVAALEYRTDRPLAFTYEAAKNHWSGCGPVQCLILADNDTEDEAFDYLETRQHGPWKQIDSYGRCKVYQGDGKLGGADNSPEWVVERMKERCRNGKGSPIVQCKSKLAANYAISIAEVIAWREDPQWRHNPEHVDRWNRVLKALDPTKGKGTAMTAAEARTYFQRGWARWERTMVTLRTIEKCLKDLAAQTPKYQSSPLFTLKDDACDYARNEAEKHGSMVSGDCDCESQKKGFLGTMYHCKVEYIPR